MISFTLIIIAITGIVSFIAFSNEALTDKLIFYPQAVTQDNEWYRFLTCGFIHADIQHLAFNMFTLYSFGRIWEQLYVDDLGVGRAWYIVLYLSSIIVSIIPSYLKNKNNYYYRSLGASGGVSAILFSTILLIPWETLRVFVIPVPAIVFAIAYVAYTIYMGKKGSDNINHDAHLWGAVFGVAFSIAVRPEVLKIFLEQLSHPHFNV
ncbi:rhomboid family intramembrane serine protease [Parasediminibacterium sp. JCM 36343]|uniref:rhomboid family intramembrane serine protease n=1 Tax=Parasediminibacterium sp. JCM 36343 TaxID=3374279 RepID=UPI00397966F5